MKINSKILIIYLCLYFNPAKALIFFNPLVNDDGTPLYFKSDSIEGILGWIDVPTHIAKVHQKNKIIESDKILAIKLANNSFKFVLPSCPNIILPVGLYCWQSSWKKYVELNDTLYQSLTRDICIINKMKSENKPIMYAQANPYDFRFCYDFETKKWTYRNPKNPVIIEYKNDCKELLNLDFEIQSQNCLIALRKQFYDLMGCTENFMREYLGAEPDQFYIPVISRDSIRIPKVEKEIIKQYFPPKLDALKRDVISLAGEVKFYTSSDLAYTYKNKSTNTLDCNKQRNDLKCSQITFLEPNSLCLKADSYYSLLQHIQMEQNYGDTVFSIFTNFDGLENNLSDPKSLIEDLNLEEICTTQANLIFRKYYQKDLNLLEDLKDKIKVKDGLITEIKKYPTAQELNKIKILYFKHVPINYYGSIINKVNYVFTGIVNLNSKLKIKTEFINQILINSIQNACAITKLNNKKKIIFNLESLKYFGYDSNYFVREFNCNFFNDLAKKFDLEIIII